MQIKALEETIDLAADALHRRSSKSGTTTEPNAFFRYFFDKVAEARRRARRRAALRRDHRSGHELAAEAHERTASARVFDNDPNIGGRYSALSYFGMVPAAIAGYDVTPAARPRDSARCTPTIAR